MTISVTQNGPDESISTIGFLKSLSVRVSLSILIITLFSFSVLHWRVMSYTEEYTFQKLDVQLGMHLRGIEDQIQTRNSDIRHLTQALSTDIALKKALDIYTSRGVNQSINRIVDIYPFFRYVLLFDAEQEVFAASTRDNRGNKIAGENVLGKELYKISGLKGLLGQSGTVSQTLDDPLAFLLEIKQYKVQWFTSPITARGEIIGWFVVCYNWESENEKILKHASEKLAENNLLVSSLNLSEEGDDVDHGLPSSNDVKSNNVSNRLGFSIGALTYSLAIKVDKSGTKKEIRKISQNVAILFIFSGALIAILLYLIVDVFIIRRLLSIKKGLADFEAGNTEFSISRMGSDEIAQLAVQFNKMASSVGLVWSRLEAAVETRTKELEDSNEELRRQKDKLGHSKTTLKLQSEKLLLINKTLFLSQGELRAQAEDLRLANDLVTQKANDLEDSSRYKSEFLANMSHELRTPLNCLLLLSQNLEKNKKGNLDESQLEDLHYIHEGGRELLELINDILDLSKVESGMLDCYIEDVYIEDVAGSIKHTFLPMATDKKLSFVVTIDEMLPKTFQSDGKRVGQILKNFLSNAIKFTQNGEISFNVYATNRSSAFNEKSITENDVVAFKVSDTGVGIAENKQKMIFEAFQQEDGSTARSYGGTGLGLTIAVQFSKMLKGKISVKSTQGKGSEFTLYLPVTFSRESSSDQAEERNVKEIGDRSYSAYKSLEPSDFDNDISILVDDEAPHAVVIETDEVAQASNLTLLKGARVLIVDDDVRNVFALSKQLAAEGMVITLASNGQMALEKVASECFDIVLMDVMMPIMNGYDAMREIRRIDAYSDTPIIALTADAMVEARNKCIEAGATEYVTKPIELDGLFRLMTELLA